MPDEQIEGMHHAPVWPIFEALALTPAYDHTAILGEEAGVPTERATMVALPTIVMYATASYPFILDTARALSKAIPHAQIHTLEGQGHNVAPEALASARSVGLEPSHILDWSCLPPFPVHYPGGIRYRTVFHCYTCIVLKGPAR
jgi:hypothetical protein